MNSKLALGTVQFGLKYGIANTTGKVSQQEVGRILDIARRNGINTLDTAIAYGDSEACLGAAGVSDFQVISKLPPLPEGVQDVESWVVGNISDSLKRLSTRRLTAVLLHRSSDIVGQHAHAYQSALARAKQRGLCLAVGVSIYAPGDLETIWTHPTGWRPDLIQAPFNVFDRRLQTSGWMQTLHEAGVRIHIRSAFLQGLLLMPVHLRPPIMAKWAALLDGWLAWCASQEQSPLQAALQFVCAQNGIERVVVGVDSGIQLSEIIEGLSLRAHVPPLDFVSDDLDLIDPSRWKRT